jgi:hypothetical protein
VDPAAPPADVLQAEVMATSTRSLLEPLVARLAEQEAIIRDRAEELGRLRERVAVSEQPDPEPAPTPEPSPPGPDGREPRGWWARLTAWLSPSGHV